jgi:hypothetical protein
MSDSERKHRKRESNAKLSNLSRIWIGDQCDRWNELRSVLRVETNAEVAYKTPKNIVCNLGRRIKSDNLYFKKSL